MGGIAEGAEVSIVRGDDDGAAAGREHAMKLFDRADHIADMLNNVDGANLAEGAVGEWPGEAVEIGDHIGARVGVPIDADRAGVLVDPAADI